MGGPMNSRQQGPGPVSDTHRIEALDAMRGIALLGVLLMNIDSYRGALWRYLADPHPDPGWLNWTTDIFRAWLVQGKAATLLGILIGIGFAAQAQRAQDAKAGF